MDDHGWEWRRVLAGKDVDLRFEAGRSEIGAEEFRAYGVHLIARSMEQFESRKLIGRNISVVCRCYRRFRARDSIDESEHHLAGITNRKTGLPKLFVSGSEKAKNDRTARRVNAGDDRLD